MRNALGRSINKNRENSLYKFFGIGNETGNSDVGIFVAKKWIEKELEVKRARSMMVKLQANKRTVVAVSTFAPQQRLTNDEKDHFYGSIIVLIASINEKDMVIIGGDLNGHVGKEVDGYDSVCGGCGFDIRNTG